MNILTLTFSFAFEKYHVIVIISTKNVNGFLSIVNVKRKYCAYLDLNKSLRLHLKLIIFSKFYVFFKCGLYVALYTSFASERYHSIVVVSLRHVNEFIFPN